MKKTLLALGVVLMMTVFASAAFAAPVEGGDHAGHEKVEALPMMKQGLATGATALVVFAITAAFLGVVVWPKIGKGLSDRENKIRSEIDAAEQARAQARAALETYQKNLAEANSKAQQAIAEAKAAQQASLAEQRAKADSDLAMMKDKAMREIEAAKKQALAEIYAQTASLATGVAGRILQREVNAADAEKFTLEAIGSFKNN